MSFTFGQSATTTTDGTFGTNTLSGASLFGGGDSKGFQSPSSASDNKVNLFSPTTSAPTFGSFAFGAKTTAPTSSLFSSPTTTTTSSAFGASSPISFGGFTSPPNQTVGSPAFGQPAAQNAPQNLSFGQSTTPKQAIPTPPFGSPTTQATFGGAANSSLSFAKPATTSVFALTPTSGFSQPQQTAATTAQPAPASFSSTPATTSAGGLTQSTPAFSSMFSKSPFSLTPITSTGTTGAATTSAPPVAPTATSGFGFGQQASNLPTTASSSFPFAKTPAASFPSSQPQATQAQPLSFAQPKPATSQPAPTAVGFGLNMNLLAKPTTTGEPATQAAQASHAGVTQAAPASQAGFVSQAGQVTQPGQMAQLGQVGQAAAQSAALTGFTASSAASSAAQPAKIGFGITTSAATSQPAATAAPALGFSASTTGGISFIGTPLTTAGLAFCKTTTATATSTTVTVTLGTATTASGILSLGKSTVAPTMATLTTTTITTPSRPPLPIASITFSQLEENINKWTLELEEQEKIFINQATQINAWDKLLISNGEMILELNNTIQTVKNEQQSLEHELDFVLAQQKELEEILAPMEKQLLSETGDRMRDPEREHMYSLAENLETQLRQMSEDLKEVIEHLNETNRSQDTNDPIVQIGRILNAHMSSMHWIDNSIAQISTKLDQLKATHDTLRRDNERSFQLTYN